jgi:H+/Cl- antiporter ClcA
MKAERKETFFEFLVFGIIVGVVEDLVAVKIATGQSITLQTLLIIILIAIPFAFLGEVIVDNINFRKFFKSKK